MTAGADAVRAERALLLELAGQWSPADWRAPSAAPGWQVRDVVAHLAAECQDAFGPRVLGLVTGRDIEHANDLAIARWRRRTPDEVLAKFRTWSGRFAAGYGSIAATPAGRLPLRLAELGWYPVGILCAVMTFDIHVHMRYDIAPVLGLSVAPADDATMAVVLAWMTAGMEQMNRKQMGFVDRPLQLTLTGAGGGSWRVEPVGKGRLRVAAAEPDEDVVAEIVATSTEFPGWATGRRPWRDQQVQLRGDTDYAARFLDAVDVV